MAKYPSDVSVHKIRAAVLRKRGGPLKIESLEMEGPRADEVLVRMVASGICHTDIGFIDDWDGATEPVVLGHEGAGVVEAVGRRRERRHAGRSRRPVLPVLRPLLSLPARTPRGLRALLRGELRVRAASTAAMRFGAAASADISSGSRRLPPTAWRPNAISSSFPGSCRWSSWRPWAAACRPGPAP